MKCINCDKEAEIIFDGDSWCKECCAKYREFYRKHWYKPKEERFKGVKESLKEKDGKEKKV